MLKTLAKEKLLKLKQKTKPTEEESLKKRKIGMTLKSGTEDYLGITIDYGKEDNLTVFSIETPSV